MNLAWRDEWSRFASIIVSRDYVVFLLIITFLTKQLIGLLTYIFFISRLFQQFMAHELRQKMEAVWVERLHISLQSYSEL